MNARDRILAALDGLGTDELEVLAIVAERLVMGRAQYGELRIASDPRDFRRECLEEVSDALVYAAVALVGPAALDAAVDGAGAGTLFEIGKKGAGTRTLSDADAAQAVESLAPEGRMVGAERESP